MNKNELYVLSLLLKYKYVNQRDLSEKSGFSLGLVNKILKSLFDKGFVDENVNVTNDAIIEFENRKPQNAIILSAGFGMRMVPIQFETPKALIEIRGEVLIERLIRQLKESGIEKIFVVVGFMKEKFEYLIDEFGVELIVNREYSTKNNLHSLKLALENLDHSYIVPCDLWFKENPFSRYEPYSWYMVADSISNCSNVSVNRKNELVLLDKNKSGNKMVGLSYIYNDECDFVKKNLLEFSKLKAYDNSFWEDTLFNKNKMVVSSKLINSDDFFEINTYEQLINVDDNSNNLENEAISIIEKVFDISKKDIYDIRVLKKGMTNRSFIFAVADKKYIMRIPGEGTDTLINRREEAEVYDVINGMGICDEIIYINKDNGYKISRYIENSRCCNDRDTNDLKLCMNKLKEFHNLKLKVGHRFNIFEKIDFYESLWNGKKSIYKDYEKTKENVKTLENYIKANVKEECLSHIDANCDNFMFTESGELKLIDWEYAGMQDPHLDIAMFCIYSMYDKKQIDDLIDIYFENKCSKENRIKIYAYISACGLLWSNWCEYKLQLGVEFGEYSIKQYHYAKEFYRIVKEMLG